MAYLVNLLPCLAWSVTSDDVFQGPYGAVTNKRRVIVSNTFNLGTHSMKGVLPVNVIPFCGG